MDILVASFKEQVCALEAFLHDEKRMHAETKIQCEKKKLKALEEQNNDHADVIDRIYTFNKFMTDKRKRETLFMLKMLDQSYETLVERIKDEKSMTEAALRNHKESVSGELAVLWEKKNIQEHEKANAKLEEVKRATKEEMITLHRSKMDNIKEFYENKIREMNELLSKKNIEVEAKEKLLQETKLEADKVGTLQFEISKLKNILRNMETKITESEQDNDNKAMQIDELYRQLEEQKSLNARKQSIAFRNKQSISRASDSGSDKNSSSSSSPTTNKHNTTTLNKKTVEINK